MRACLFFFFWTPTALAGETIVLHAGDNPSLAATQVHAAAELEDEGLTPADLQPRTLSDVVAGQAPALEGEGSLSVCDTTATTLSALRQVVERAEDAVSYMETEQAVAHLRTGVSTLKCLGESVHPEVGARLFYLQGIVLHSLENETGARVAFGKALAYQSDLHWDDYFAPNALALFEETQGAMAEANLMSLRVIPQPPEGGLWVDGRPVEFSEGKFEIQEGEHLVQLQGKATMQLRIEATEDGSGHTLILPQAAQTQDLIWVNDDARREVLSIVLDATLPTDSRVYVVAAGRIWSRSPGGDWSELEFRGDFSRLGSTPSVSLPQTLLWGGTGLALGGTTLLAISRAQMQQAVDLLSGNQSFSTDQINEATGQYNAASGRYITGAAIATVGIAMAGSSFFLSGQDSLGASFIGVPGSWAFHLYRRW